MLVLDSVIRKKAAPLEFERRSACAPVMPLAPSVGTIRSAGTVFSAGALALALMACRTEQVGPEPQRVVNPAPSVVEKEETIEAPVQIKARAAEPTTAPAAPIPTTVVIRPGHIPRMAGVMVPRHRQLGRTGLDL
jgi:hypothetical protein